MKLWQLQALMLMCAAALILVPMALAPKVPKHLRSVCERPANSLEWEACQSFR